MDDGIIIDVHTEIVEEEPPLLFNLTDLQIEANRVLALSAAETARIAQVLYETGYLTYPRTSSNYISPDMAQSVSALFSGSVNTGVNAIGTGNTESSPLTNSQNTSDTHATSECMERASVYTDDVLISDVERTSDYTDDALISDSVYSIKSDKSITYADFSELNDEINRIGRDNSFSIREKVDRIKTAYYNTTNRKDINVPIDEKYIKEFDKTGKIIYDWPPKLGFKEESIAPITKDLPLPKTWDRYGYMGGANFASVPESGPYSYSERAIPYVENPDAYHKGIFNIESYFEKIDAIIKGDIDSLNSILQTEGIDKVDKKTFLGLRDQYDDYLDDIKDYIGEGYNAPYGLQGEAASWKDLCGGAKQFVTPFNGKVLSRLGICKEEV